MARARIELAIFLRRSAESYDAGEHAESKHLALHIRIMLHDTRQQTSLLTHLGIKERLPLLDTAPAEPPPGVIQMDFGLCDCRMTTGTPGRVEFRAPLGQRADDRAYPPACFADWSSRPVLNDTQSNDFSRSDLVLGVANQDGGAHIDATLKPAYAALTRQHSHGFGQADPGEPNTAALTFAFEGGTQAPQPDAEPVSNSIALASVRQITHELLTSLETSVVDDGEGVRLRREICPIPWDEAPSVPRNDPCPCGGGRKFKKCFGRREPRRRSRLPG